MAWKDEVFLPGKKEMCMAWTREVLMAACGQKFESLQSMNPWDKHLLSPTDGLAPLFANSLASEELGTKVDDIPSLEAGDLVFLKNTYGNWADGVITHVGIALGDGKFIHRQTSNDAIVRVQDIPEKSFDAGLRLDPGLCPQ